MLTTCEQIFWMSNYSYHEKHTEYSIEAPEWLMQINLQEKSALIVLKLKWE